MQTQTIFDFILPAPECPCSWSDTQKGEGEAYGGRVVFLSHKRAVGHNVTRPGVATARKNKVYN